MNQKQTQGIVTLKFSSK